MPIRIFRPPLPGMDRMVLEIERALVSLSGRTSTASTVTASTPITAQDGSTFANATGGAITISLPPAASVPGRIFTVKKIDASANTVTIDPDGAETIDGAATNVISAQWASVTFQSDGTGWLIL